jgi:16S rRNA (adenine1518-N6/adenine1519-N6)-dimethyltransferase
MMAELRETAGSQQSAGVMPDASAEAPGEPSTPDVGPPSTPDVGPPSTPDVGPPSTPDVGSPSSRASSPAALLRQLGLRPRKGLSQSFLTDVGVTRQIAAAAGLEPDDEVLEVGPGLGILTQQLARRARRVVAFELDRDLAAALPRLVPANVEIVQGDALKLDPVDHLTGPYKLVANLPYQITSPFLFRYLGLQPGPTVLVLMIQREVAERIAARPGDLSYLAVAVQSASRPRIVRLVPPGAFYPRPKVESAVIRLDPLAEPLVPPAQRQDFLTLVRAGFGQPRKQLLNSLHQGLTQEAGNRDAWSRDEVRALLERGGIESERRPQELALAEWRALFDAFDAYRAVRGDRDA